MASELLDFFNLSTDKDLQESLRLALAFKEEIDEATRAYLEMLQISINPTEQSADEISQIMRDAINSALLTGIRTYRLWMQSQGIEVKTLKRKAGKIFLSISSAAARATLYKSAQSL